MVTTVWNCFNVQKLFHVSFSDMACLYIFKTNLVSIRLKKMLHSGILYFYLFPSVLGNHLNTKFFLIGGDLNKKKLCLN